MDEILAAIDLALAKKGLSDAAASRLAVGHPSLIKNLRNSRSGQKRINTIDSLVFLADALDLEFYFGERKPAAITESQRANGADFSKVRLLVGGEPLGDLNVESPDGPFAPVAFGVDFAAKLGVDLAACAAIFVTCNSMAPSVSDGDYALVCRKPGDRVNGEPYAFADKTGEIKIRRLDWIDDQIVVRSDNPDLPLYIYDAREAQNVTIIGRVKWAGRSLKKDKI